MQRGATRRTTILEWAVQGHDAAALAAQTGIPRRTVHWHLSQPETRAELRRLQDARLHGLTRQALAAAGAALAVLQAVAEDAAQPAAARVSAARAVLDTAARLLETADLAERVEALEAVYTARAAGRSA